MSETLFKGDGDNGKDLFIGTPLPDLRITLDIDDVVKIRAAYGIRRLLAVLNDHWNDPEYAHIEAEEVQDSEEAWDGAYEKGMAIIQSISRGEQTR